MKLSVIREVRTNNFNDSEIINKIQTLWNDSMKDIQKLNYKGNIYGVYHKYESNYKGDYTVSIMIEDNKKGIELSLENYKIFNVEKADKESVFLTWHKIWKLEEDGKLHRAYTYDFEKYDPSGRIEIYIKEK